VKELLVFAMLLIPCTAFAFASNVAGQWKSTMETGGGPIELTFTYAVDGDTLTGAMATYWGEHRLSDGRVRGDEFEYRFEVWGHSYQHEGRLVGDDEIEITSTRDDGEEAQFTLRRASSLPTTYGAPIAEMGAPDYQVRADGRPVFVYNSRVAAFAGFSFAEGADAVEIAVTPLAPVESVDLRPLSYGIEPELDGNTIRFTLARPCHVSVEINGSTRHPLFLFANPPETDAPKPDDPGVRYYKGGEIHRAGVVTLKDNETVYIEGGAVVRGAFEAYGAKNVRIMGRGILDGSGYSKGEQNMIRLSDCSATSLQGITILNSGAWTVKVERSTGLAITNLKIVNWRDWDDGIDICGCTEVLVDGCFIRTKDDCVAIKAVQYGEGPGSVDHDSYDILVTNSVLWNGVWGNALEIGFETRTEHIHDIVFRNIDVIHVQGWEGTLSIHNGDRATVSNVLYEDLRIERVEGFLFDLKILHSRYTKDAERGHIKNITFRDIAVVGERFPPSIIQGFDDDHRVESIVFENVTIRGQHVDSLEAGKFEVSNYRDITFR
jgi:hypothetical protein